MSIADFIRDKSGAPIEESDPEGPEKHADATDLIKNSGPVGKIVFQPIFGDQTFKSFNTKIEFKAFIKTFRDEHKTKWDMSELFVGTGKGITHRQGRQNRTLTFSFDVPSHSLHEARINLKNLTTLVQMMYPTRNWTGDMTSRNAKDGMVQWKIDFANLINNYTCIVETFAVVPDFNAGVYYVGNTTMLPKLYTVDVTAEYNPPNPNLFNKLTEEGTITFNHGDRSRPTYPYGVGSYMASTTPKTQIEPSLKSDTIPSQEDEPFDQSLGQGHLGTEPKAPTSLNFFKGFR